MTACIPNAHRFQAYCDDALDKVNNVPWVVRLLIRIVDYAARLVLRNRVALHNPFNRALAIDDVIVRGKCNATQRNHVVVDNERRFLITVDKTCPLNFHPALKNFLL